MARGMSDSDSGKKEEESIALDYFLPEYNFATGRNLEYHPFCSRSEAPDFICWDENGVSVGVELTKVVLNPRYVQPVEEEDFLLSGVDAIHASIERKRGLGKQVIVVLMVDGGFETLVSELSGVPKSTFEEYGLKEIWFADYSKVEPYGSLELFCLAPSELFGHYIPSFDGRKPYG